MSYKYYNQFHMTDELESILTKLISDKEGKNYICKIISATIPEHTEEESGYTGDVAGLSGADIAYMNENYGHFYKIKVPSQEYEYIAVMESIAYQYFQKYSFGDKREISNTLKALSVVFASYDGIFNSNIFYEKFPYLKAFFDSLDEWRAETGRVTIDDDILESSAKKVLNISKQGLLNH